MTLRPKPAPEQCSPRSSRPSPPRRCLSSSRQKFRTFCTPQNRWACTLLTLWTGIFVYVAVKGYLSCKLVEIHPLPANASDVTVGLTAFNLTATTTTEELPVASFGLKFYKKLATPLAQVLPNQHESLFAEKGCVAYPKGSHTHAESGRPGNQAAAAFNTTSLYLGGIFWLALAQTICVDCCRIVFLLLGVVYLYCSIGQAFSFLTLVDCQEADTLDRSGIAHLYEDECRPGPDIVFPILASIGWLFTAISCFLLWRHANDRPRSLDGDDEEEEEEAQADDDAVLQKDEDAEQASGSSAEYEPFTLEDKRTDTAESGMTHPSSSIASTP